MTEETLPHQSLSSRIQQARRDATDPLNLPDRAVFWTWVWRSVRPVVGWILAALGALALFLGWYGVSGQSLTAKQIPYLVSGGLVGIALIVIAGVFLATEDWRRQLVRLETLERKVDDLLVLLTTDVPTSELPTVASVIAAAKPDEVITTMALPTGSVFHRPDCSLIVGKSSAKPVGRDEITRRSLSPCRVCDPPLPS